MLFLELVLPSLCLRAKTDQLDLLLFDHELLNRFYHWLLHRLCPLQEELIGLCNCHRDRRPRLALPALRLRRPRGLNYHFLAPRLLRQCAGPILYSAYLRHQARLPINCALFLSRLGL